MAVSDISFPPFLRLVRFFVGEAEMENWYTLDEVAEATELEHEALRQLLNHLVSAGICETRTLNGQLEYTTATELSYKDWFAKLNRELTDP